MKQLQIILKQINKVTLEIEEKYPELYRTLDENPITISTDISEPISVRDLTQYLVTLKELLEIEINKQF